VLDWFGGGKILLESESLLLVTVNMQQNNITIIALSCISDYRRDSEIVVGFSNHLQVVTTNNYYTIADLHNLQSLHNNILFHFH
jgi:hypothetical protein